MSTKIAIQGIPGSFHHQVALECFGDASSIKCYDVFEQVAKSVAEGSCDFGIMAIENSIAGAILPNYDLIDRHKLYIDGEHYLPISHNLMALPGTTLEDLTEVQSHPMALLQCHNFFEKYPTIKLTSEKDTASVAKKIRQNGLSAIGAIASKTAADIYGLDILAEDIQSFKENYTRFILLKSGKSTGVLPPSKASLKITIKNEKGGLAKLLTTLAEHDLDLSKIQSIPLMERPWDYAFFIDVLISDWMQYKNSLHQLETTGATVKILGEYINQKP
ncbi:prephenate dehydratase [Anditalea andensis]|uniref:prephenate dehydratase n=1 Tax=Anditalea andensis TaxID=1048983 RepID=A0A074L1E6_9BACT|nr:prephenate dehydratase [Anditalea andensis]